MENVYSSYADISSHPGSLYAFTMISMLKCKKVGQGNGSKARQRGLSHARGFFT